MRSRFVPMFLLPILWCAGATMAAAQERGVVLNFEGPGHRRVRNYVVRGVQGSLDLQPVRRAASAARSAGFDLDSTQGMRAAATALDAEILIGGTVTGRGRRARVQLRAYDNEGAEIGSGESSASPGRSGRRAVAEASSLLLEQVRANLNSRAAEERARQRWTEDVVISDDEVEEADSAPRPSTGWPVVRAVLGVEARDRNAEVIFEPGIGERGYEASFHSELHLRIESFPLGRSEGGARGLYVEGEFAHSVSLSTEDAETRTPVDSSAWRLMLQLGYIFPIADDAARLGVLVGFGVDAFNLGPNTILPSTSFTQLRAGLMTSIRLLEDKLRVRVDGAYRHGFGLGDIAVAFGSDASVRGFDLGVTLESRFGPFVLAGRAGVTRYGLSFAGDATEPNAAAASERSGKDRAFNLGVQLGVAFD